MNDISSVFRRSVFARCALLIAGCAGLVAITLSWLSYQSAMTLSETSIKTQAHQVTGFVGEQAGGAVRFGKLDALSVLFDKGIVDSGGAALGAVAINANGEIVLETGEIDPSALAVLGGRSLELEAETSSQDGMTIAVPITFGKNGEIVGAVVMKWSAEVAQATAIANQISALMISAAVLFAVTGLALFLLRRSLIHHLVSLTDSVRNLALGNYTQTIPATERSDEIGKIANAVNELQSELMAMEKLRIESAFKSAGYQGSSTAAFLVDDRFAISYMNAAAVDSLRTFNTALSATAQGTLIGSQLGALHEDLDTLIQRSLSAESFPIEGDIELEDHCLATSISEIRSANGDRIGFVAELRDVTAVRASLAIQKTIDNGQCTAEFSRDGTVRSVNENLCRALGSSQDDLLGRNVGHLFKCSEGSPSDADNIWTLVLAGEPLDGKFQVEGQDGVMSIIDGGFSAVLDDRGTVTSAIFLGRDVTDQDTKLKESEDLRTRMEAEQVSAMEALRRGLDGLAAGDLTVKINDEFSPRYEQLREDFNIAVRQLATALQEVTSNAASIGGEVHALTSAADQMSARTERQAATLEETAAALDELTASVKTAADGSVQADQVVAHTTAEAKAGESVVKDAVSAMQEIEGSSDQISKIISVIDDIAFQTNLLALNAGVEAARAGEAGRGFAVVASEVRALAQRSSDAAREIDGLISNSTAQVKRGVALVGQTGNALEKILVSVSNVAEIVSRIAASSAEQSTGLSEINTAVNQLDQVTQQNAAMFEETSAMSHTLASATQALVQAVTQFKTSDEAGETWSGEERQDDRKAG